MNPEKKNPVTLVSILKDCWTDFKNGMNAYGDFLDRHKTGSVIVHSILLAIIMMFALSPPADGAAAKTSKSTAKSTFTQTTNPTRNIDTGIKVVKAVDTTKFKGTLVTDKTFNNVKATYGKPYMIDATMIQSVESTQQEGFGHLYQKGIKTVITAEVEIGKEVIIYSVDEINDLVGEVWESDFGQPIYFGSYLIGTTKTSSSHMGNDWPIQTLYAVTSEDLTYIPVLTSEFYNLPILDGMQFRMDVLGANADYYDTLLWEKTTYPDEFHADWMKTAEAFKATYGKDGEGAIYTQDYSQLNPKNRTLRQLIVEMEKSMDLRQRLYPERYEK